MRSNRVLVWILVIVILALIGVGIFFLIRMLSDREDEITAGERLYIQQLMPNVITMPGGGMIDLRNVPANLAYGRFDSDFSTFTLRFGNITTINLEVTRFRQRRAGMTATMSTIGTGPQTTFTVSQNGNYITFDAYIVYYVEVNYRDDATSTVRQSRRETDVMLLRRG